MPSHRESGGSSSRSRIKPDAMMPSTSKAHSNYKKEPTQSPGHNWVRYAKNQLQLNALQKAIEELLAENVDNQKTIHGEITYMNTGEYPTIELNDRPMPTYQLRREPPLKQPSEFRQMKGPGFSYYFLNVFIIKEDEDQPSILDVPQRFWNWSREYLRHITEEYLSEFKEKVVERFSDEEIQKYLSNENSHIKPAENGGSESHRSPKKLSTPRLNGSREVLQTPLLSKGRVKRRQAYLIEETNMPSPKLAKKKTHEAIEFLRAKPSKVQSLVAKVIRTHQNSNGMTPVQTQHSNGIEMEANDDEDYKTDVHPRLNGTCDQKPNGFHLSPLLNGTASRPIELDSTPEYSPSKHKSEDLRSIGKALASLGVQKGILPKKTDDFCKISMATKKLLLQTATTICHSRTEKKKKELAELYNKTKPIILELYERIQAEYALYETSRRLDITDDKVFELGAKYERLHSLNKEQKQESKAALEAREKAAYQFYRLRQQANQSQKPNTPKRKQSQNRFD
uniref:Uncharacterized protein n=1 Tax=Ditylenchus dipsaci TaxID=166011 RepID=A0A915D348_9BILA